MKTTLIAILCTASSLHAADRIRNRLIDYPKFIQIAENTEPVREQRRVSEEKFMELAAQPGTVVLDARSADKYAMRHVKGAVSLPFTDFTESALAKAIPTKATRVLIYCNNNFRGSPVSLAPKNAAASLNISTFIALTTYGYTNVYELGPLLDVAATKLQFEGSEVAK